MLREADRNGEIGHDRIGINLAGIAVEAGGKIDREDKSVPLNAEAIEFTRGLADWLAQERLGPDAQKSVEDDRATNTLVGRGRGRRRVPQTPQVSCGSIRCNRFQEMGGERQSSIPHAASARPPRGHRRRYDLFLHKRCTLPACGKNCRTARATPAPA